MSKTAPATNGTHATVSSSLEENQDERENSILRLFQFYTSNSNLPYDKFLFTLSQEQLSQEEKLARPGTGWMEISTLATFKRMKPYADFSTAQIADILRKSAGPAIEVDEAGKRIRRIEPISQQLSSGQVDRSIYAKGFPTEEDENLQLRIERFFQRSYQTNAVRMRRENNQEGKKTAKGKFKGSVFVEFANKADKEAFLALDPPPTFPGQDKPLELLPKREYLDKKAEEHNVQANHKDTTPKTQFNAFTELKYMAKNKHASSPSMSSSSPRKRVIDYRDVQLDVENGKIVDPEKVPVKDNDHSYLMRFTGARDVDFADLKEKLAGTAKVNFIEMSRERDAAQYVCFEKEIAEEDLKKIQDLELVAKDGNKFEWHLATADEAKDYHQRRAAFHARRADFAASKEANTPHRGGRSGGGRDRGRGASSSSGSRRHDSKPYDRRGGRSRSDADSKSKEEKTANALSSAPKSEGAEPEGGQLKRKADEPSTGAAEAKKTKTEDTAAA